MRTYLRSLIESVSQSLWLMPALSIALAMVAAFWMLDWEEYLDASWSDLPLIYRSGRDSSLAIVGTIVGALITVAGVTFSITIVSLTLASSQFGPRLLRNFLRSRPSQVTLGALVGSFVYGVLIMTGMDQGWESGEAHPSVTLMIALACACVCLIVYYIHHVAISIQADELIASVYRELEQVIDKLPESREGPREDEDSRDADWGEPSTEFLAERSGYVTAIGVDSVVRFAAEHGVKVSFKVRPGLFVARGECVANGYGEFDGDSFSSKLSESIFIRDKRTPEQDLEFLIDQLVEIALRAISPGINDPNTAIICIDYLSAVLCQLAGRELPTRIRRDDSGEARLAIPFTDFEGLVNDSFDQLRQAGRSYPEIVIQLLCCLKRVVKTVGSDEKSRAALRRQFEQIVEAFEDQDSLSSKDRKDIEERILAYRVVDDKLAREPAASHG